MALQQVTRAPADGHTLVLTASETMTVNPYLYDLKYKPVDDLAAIVDLLGGHIDAMIDNAAAQVPNVQTGKVRALFVTTQERSESLPGVPTAQEAGLPGFVTSGWFGLAAPKGTPQAIIDRLNAVIVQGMAQPEVRKKLLDAGWMPIGSSPAEAAARARSDLARFGQIARQIELKKRSN